MESSNATSYTYLNDLVSSKNYVLYKILYNKVLHCDQCNYSSRVQRNFMKHIKMMHTKRNAQCDQCDKKFAEPGKLKEHKVEKI